MRKMKAFARFYSLLDKRERVGLKNEVIEILCIPNSTFYYKVHHGNLLPSEAIKIRNVLLKYGASKDELKAMGVIV